MPKRIQRKRTKGLRLPAGAVCVDRSTKWGNRFIINPYQTAEEAVAKFRACWSVGWIINHRGKIITLEDVQRKLAGRDLACYCGLDQPCHGDVYLELANPKGLTVDPELTAVTFSYLKQIP
jgi:hypothetical protein